MWGGSAQLPPEEEAVEVKKSSAVTITVSGDEPEVRKLTDRLQQESQLEDVIRVGLEALRKEVSARVEVVVVAAGKPWAA